MRKFWKSAIAFALSLGFMLSAAACGTPSGQYALPYYDQSADDVYNDDLYYKNEMKAACADTTVIYIDDESDPDYGWFFMYPTSDSDFGCHGFSAYRSKDMESWEYVGPIFEPKTESWSHDNMWAPEVIRDADDGKYYLFYSAKDGSRTDGKYFDNLAEKNEYHAIEKTVNGYDYVAATAAMEEEKAKFSTDNAFEGYTDAQKISVENQITNYDSRKTAAENGNASDEDKQTMILGFAREALIAIRAVKIHFTSANNPYSIGIAISDSPRGPFVQYVNEEGTEAYNENARTLSVGTPFISHEDMYVGAEGKNGYHAVFLPIDVHPYVDPATGKKYIYFANTYMGNNVYGMEAGEKWTDDPKWETLTYLARTGYQTVDGNKRTDYTDENINEGPYMYYDAESATYYLTFSINGYPNKMYGVAQAIGKSPLGPFTKINRADGGLILSSQPE